jgi:hypothetical protein
MALLSQTMTGPLVGQVFNSPAPDTVARRSGPPKNPVQSSYAGPWAARIWDEPKAPAAANARTLHILVNAPDRRFLRRWYRGIASPLQASTAFLRLIVPTLRDSATNVCTNRVHVYGDSIILPAL